MGCSLPGFCRNGRWLLAAEAKRCSIAGTVPDTQDFNRFAVLVHLVINQVRIPQQFAHAGTLLDELTGEGLVTASKARSSNSFPMREAV
jgi:hypothetical protein